jgi:hypothetical protein
MKGGDKYNESDMVSGLTHFVQYGNFFVRSNSFER